MKPATIMLYSFDELSPDAQRAAIAFAEEHWGFDRAGEYRKSIEALSSHFGATIRDYEIDWSGGARHSSMYFELPYGEDLGEKEIEARLLALGSFNPETGRGNGDCKLTGCAYDESAIDGFRLAWRAGERDLETLLQAAFNECIKAAHADYAYDFGPEGFAETCEANGYDWTEDGKLWKGK